MIRFGRASVLAYEACLIGMLCGGDARGNEREVCASASEAAQQFRIDGKLVSAHEQLLVCVRRTCPAIVRGDCERWLSEVEQALPTVIVGAKDADGHDLVDVRVLVDGVVVKQAIDGKAAAVDPGPHTLRYEHEGSPAVEDRVVIREAEKERLLTVHFTTSGVPATPAAPASTTRLHLERTGPAPVEHTSGSRVLGYVLGGAGLASIGVFTFFAAKGQSDYDRCKAAVVCPQSDVDTIAVERAAAWVTLGLGAVALGASAVLVLAARSQSQPTMVRASLFPLAGGAGLGAGATF
jgi:hypothetical protein